MTATVPQHIWLDERGIARIDNTRFKVVDVALGQIAYGWSASEIHEQYPDLSLGQIHAALGFYHDHRDELDRQIAADLQFADQTRAELGPTPFEMRIRHKLTRAD